MKNHKAKKENCQIPKQAVCNNVATKKEYLGNIATNHVQIIDIDMKYKNLVFFALCEFRKNANNAFLDFLKVDRLQINELIEQLNRD